MADKQRVENVLQGLRALQEPQLSILRLSEPIGIASTSHRASDASSSAFDNPLPQSLEADLSHYKVSRLIASSSRSRFNLFRNYSPSSASPTSNK